MSRSKKILEEIHPLSIIQEVEKWPVLYVKDNPERANAHFRNKVWHEVAKTLFTDWDTFNDWEKEAKVTDLMKKWRNLRDTFKRQLEAEKKIREGHDIKKKTYVYFKHMLYLLPHITSIETSTFDPAVEPKLDEFFTRHIAAKQRQTKAKRKSSDKDKTLKKKKRLERQSVVSSVIYPEMSSTSTNSMIFPELASTSNNKEELIDEDKHFLMSLVPSFKRMSDDEKLEAKVEILKVIKGIRKKNFGNRECNSVEDSLSYNLEDSDLNQVKNEMVTVDGDESDDVESNSSENS